MEKEEPEWAVSARRRQLPRERSEKEAKENTNVGNLDESSLTKTFYIFIFRGKTQRGVPSEVYGCYYSVCYCGECYYPRSVILGVEGERERKRESRPRKRSTFA